MPPLPGALAGPASKPPAARAKAGEERATAPPAPPPRPVRFDTTDLLGEALPSDRPPPRHSVESGARELIEDCEAELARKPDRPRAARLHYEIGRQHEHPLGELDRAIEHYQTAHELAREDLRTLRSLRRCLLAAGVAEQTLPLFDRELRLVADAETRAQLLLQKGRVLDGPLAQPAAAREAFRAALALDSNDPAILKATELSAAQAGDWATVARTLERSANAARSPALRAALLVQRGHVLETRLGQPDLAVEQYEAALDADSGCSRALVALKRLYHTRGRLRDRVRMLELEAESSVDPAVQTAALYEAAGLWSDRLGNRRAAIEALQRALQMRPDDPLLLDELSRLLEEEQDYRGVVEAMARRVETVGDEASVPLLHRLGQLCHDRLDEADAAAAFFERALRQDPTYTPALQGLAPIYLEQRRHEELIQMLLREADATDDSQRRAAAHARVARLYEETLGDSQRAASQHERALAAVDLYPESFRALTRLYANTGRWTELAALYERSVERGEPDESVLHLLRIGTIHEMHLRDPVQALHAYRRALAIDPANLEAIQSLARVAESSGRYGELVEALEREADRTENVPRKLALLQRAGEVLDEQLHDRERAVATLRRVLDLDGGYAPALGALGRIYYRTGRWEELLSTYRAELELAEQPEQAARLHLKLGEVCERHLAEHARAAEHYRAAGELMPKDLAATEALGRKLREQQGWPELLELWERSASQMESAPDRALAHYRRGEVLELRLGRIDQAVSAYEQALEENPSYRPALSALARLRFNRGEWSELAEQLWQDAERLKDPAARLTALVRAAAIHRDQLDDPASAIDGFMRVLEEDSTHPEALRALESLAREAQDRDTWRRVLQVQATAFPDDSARLVALRELLRLQVEEGDEEATRSTLEQLLELSPGDPEALEQLEAMALRTHDGALIARVDALRVEHESDPERRAAHRTRLAQSLEEQEPERALSLYREALADDPESLAAVRGISRLAQQAATPTLLAEAAEAESAVLGDHRKAAQLLVQSGSTRLAAGEREAAARELERALELDPDNRAASHYLRDALLPDDPARLVQQLNRTANACSEDALAGRLAREAARVAADVQSDLPAAISALRRALRRAPNDPETQHMLASTLERDGHWNDAMSHYEQLLTLTEDDETRVTAHLRLAQLFEQRAHDPEAALGHLRSALELAPRHRDALRQLSDILSRTREDSDEAAEAVTRLVETARSDSARVAALLQLSRVETRRGYGDRAALALIEAVAVDGPDSGAGAAFRDALGKSTTWKQYAAALERFIQHKGAAPTAVSAARLELARAYADHLGTPERALQGLQQAVVDNPRDLALHTELADRLVQAGDYERAGESLRAALQLDVERAQSWRALSSCLAWSHGEEASSLALDALVVLGSANRAERTAHRSRAAAPVQAHPGSLAPDAAPELTRGLVPAGPAGELLKTLAEGLGKLYPPKLEQYGVSSRSRLSSRSDHPLRTLADELALIVGAPDFDLYLHAGRSTGVELADTVALMVPEQLGDKPRPVQAFTLTRLLMAVTTGCHPIFVLTPRELEVLLASYARNVAPSFGEGLTSEDVLNDQARRLHRALPRRVRKQADELARQHVAHPISPLTDWVRSRELVTLRAATLLADDLPAVAEQLSLAQGTADEGPLLTDLDNSALTDILHFWVASPTLELRRRAGLPRVAG